MIENILVNFDNYKRIWSVSTELPVSFTLKYSSDIFDPNNHDLISLCESNRCLCVIDKNVYNLYKDKIENYFKILKIELLIKIINISEENKSLLTCEKILNFFEKNNIRRREPVIAIGGGVLLDIVGFCASVYRRGIPYIKVPTTLLAIVDASVGAKVAINHFSRRNRLGAYYPALTSLLDKKFINTQDEREIVNGLSEILKLAIIKNYELFNLLENNYEQLITEKFQYGAVPVRVINLSIAGMIEELSTNLWEKRLDRCVDFGHSFSPLIEMNNISHLHHGEAVVLDCLLSSCLSNILGYLSMQDLKRIYSTAENLKMITYHSDFTNIDLLMKSLSDTVVHRNGNQNLPIPLTIGNYKIINNVSKNEIQAAINIFKSLRKL